MRHAALVKFIPDIDRVILSVRDQKVILDMDLAAIYGVTTKALNQALRRNSDRFPADLAFLLTVEKKADVVAICDHLTAS